MRFISTSFHGCLDYAMGIALLVAAALIGHGSGSLVSWLPALLGAGLLAYSLVTDYELALVRFIPIRTHLLLDALGGVVLVVFALAGTSGVGLGVFAILGLLEIGSALLTRTTSDDGSGLERASPLDPDHRSMPAASDPRSQASLRPKSPVAPPGSNVEQLRRAIDSGDLKDKVAMTDPSMAPLGSDDEAAVLHDEKGLRAAREQEKRRD